MGQFSVEKPVAPGSVLSGNQHKGDIQQFCPQATYGNIADCMRPHLGETSDQCRGAMAFIASPAGD